MNYYLSQKINIIYHKLNINKIKEITNKLNEGKKNIYFISFPNSFI